MFSGLWRSPIFIGVLLITIGLQVVIMQTPMGMFFKVIPLNGTEWGVSIAIGAGAVLVSMVTRLLSKIPCGSCGGCGGCKPRRRRGGGGEGGGTELARTNGPATSV